MDFFASQDSARRKTRTLVLYFVLAVVCLILMIYLAVVFAIRFAGDDQFALWQPQLLGGVAFTMCWIILLGSLYKTFQLRGGGDTVARMLGGRLLQTNSSDLAEQRLLNVVQEMALASGIPAPPVYVLDREKGINAFAAGYAPGDAVIGVNRGTLDYLSRDELQGVIAHEFSHVLNGDMRLNLRLIGLLHGILLISIIGYYILRFGGSSGRSSRKDNKGAGAVLIVGLAMWLIGSAGLFFARLIKAAISRQREYLADASAVQFTRNPDGISGALKKIGGAAEGSRVRHPQAESASHMFFASSVNARLVQWLSTHPPLDDRIRRIDPQFDGKYPKLQRPEPAAGAAEQRKAARRPQQSLGSVLFPGTMGERFKLNPVLALEAVGTVQPQMVDAAAQLLANLPDALREAINDPFSARAVAYALLLEDDPVIGARQREIVRKLEGQSTLDSLNALWPLVRQSPPEARLPLLETIQAALRALSPPQYARFRETIVQLVNADQQISLLEFVLQRILLTHLDRIFSGAKPPRPKYLSLSAVVEPATNLLALLAHVGSNDGSAAERAYAAGIAAMGLKVAPLLRPQAECTTDLLDDALEKLDRSSPMVKKRVLAGLFAAAAVDDQMKVREVELLRAVADSIGCPLPPLVAGVKKGE